jgi:hypothetical protein
MTVYGEPLESLVCLGIIAAGIPVFIFFVKLEKSKIIEEKISIKILLKCFKIIKRLLDY